MLAGFAVASFCLDPRSTSPGAVSIGVVGLFSGVMVSRFRMPPFIATLGMMVSARGIARWWSNGQPVSFPTESYGTLANGDILGRLTFGLLSWPGQNPAVVFVVLAILFHVVMRKTLYGKRVRALYLPPGARDGDQDGVIFCLYLHWVRRPRAGFRQIPAGRRGGNFDKFHPRLPRRRMAVLMRVARMDQPRPKADSMSEER